ncbi:hypothetical protein JL721_2999 [Aureococcus anophagefferens]|nr:hypothetical protein JL721_2999 [Aureococcus anophagefferens]
MDESAKRLDADLRSQVDALRGSVTRRAWPPSSRRRSLTRAAARRDRLRSKSLRARLPAKHDKHDKHDYVKAARGTTRGSHTSTHAEPPRARDRRATPSARHPAPAAKPEPGTERSTPRGTSAFAAAAHRRSSDPSPRKRLRAAPQSAPQAPRGYAAAPQSQQAPRGYAQPQQAQAPRRLRWAPQGQQAPALPLAPQPPQPPAPSQQFQGFQPGAGQPAPGAAPGAATPAAPVVIDEAAQCDPRFMRCTVGKLANSGRSPPKSPSESLCQPMALDTDHEAPLDVVNFGSTGIVRCKKCRAYVNPFVSWVNNGRQWRCNVCGFVNDVPNSYFCQLDPETGERRDKQQRPELCKGSVELVAVITFDASVHFYNLKASLSQPQMVCVPDLSDLFVPLPDDLLVNLAESRSVVEALLDALPAMHSASSPSSASALGPALTAAYRVMGHVGGKLCVFQAGLPNCGEAALKMRENPRVYGTEGERALLHAEPSGPGPDAVSWYETKAVEFSRLQICVELFVAAHTYADVATLGLLPKITAGQLYFYPGSGARRRRSWPRAAPLTRPTGFEAVMRVRCTRACASRPSGAIHIRGHDLLALPNCARSRSSI